jgi:ribosomal protein S18 acetylase RimI-like enzyme
MGGRCSIFEDPIKFQDKVYFKKLEKKNNIDFEVEIQSRKIIEDGDLVLEILKNKDGVIIICRTMYEVPEEEEFSIHLKLFIISRKGVTYPEPRLFSTRHDDHVYISDIKIFGDNKNKGFGTILMKKLKEICLSKDTYKISGKMHYTDLEHKNRLIYFYNKHGFIIDEYEKIEWTGIKSNNSTLEE